MLKDVYSKELADRSPAARGALADKFLQDAGNSSSAPGDEFVLLGGAIQAAQEASDLSRSFAAADAMAKDFKVDALSLKAQSLLKLSPKQFAGNPMANQRAGLELMDELDKAGDYDQAERVGEAIERMSVTDSARTVTQQRVKVVHDKQLAVKRAEASVLVLKTSPDDPAANLAVGRYFCFIRDDWARGLPMLAKGSDALMKSVSLQDLGTTRASSASGPSSHDSQVVGDAWWDGSDREKTPAWKTAMQERALLWYRRALPGAGGIAKIKIEKRIQSSSTPDPLAFGATQAPEAKAIIAKMRPLTQGAEGCEPFGFHEGTELSGGSPGKIPGSYAKLANLLNGDGKNFATIKEPWPAGLYLIVFRMQQLTGIDDSSKTEACAVELCRDSGNITLFRLRTNNFQRNQWTLLWYCVIL